MMASVVPEMFGASQNGTYVVDGFVHGSKNIRVLAHAEVVIGTPDSDFAPGTLSAVKGTGKPAPDAADIGKFTVTAFRL